MFDMRKNEIPLLKSEYGRRKLMYKYGKRNLPLSFKNDYGEGCLVFISYAGLKVKTRRRDGAEMLCEYDRRGNMTCRTIQKDGSKIVMDKRGEKYLV